MKRTRFVHLLAELLDVGVEVKYPTKKGPQVHLAKKPGIDNIGEILWEWVIEVRSHTKHVCRRRKSHEISSQDIERIVRISHRSIMREQRLALRMDQLEYFHRLEDAYDAWTGALRSIVSEHVLEPF